MVTIRARNRKCFDTTDTYFNWKKYNKSPAQIALRFLVQRRISVIPKSNKESRLIENKDIFDFNLTDEEMKTIMKLDHNKTLFPWIKSFFKGAI